ncbi:hypothetical protein K5X80_07265 [Caenibius sp. WL]|nr:hypothetical protein K5X80_07265 [Caenibius sp. WL]
MHRRATTTSSRSWRSWARIVLAGPVAIIVALTLLAGMPLWLPGGAAGIDNLVFPLVFAPLIWAALFFHACLDPRVGRVALVAAVLFLMHGGLVVSRFMGEAQVVEQIP